MRVDDPRSAVAEPFLLRVARKARTAVARVRIDVARRRACFGGHRVLSEAAGNDAIAAALGRGKPFMAGRLGFHELDCVVSARGVRAQGGSSRLKRWNSRTRAEPGRWDPELLRCLRHIAGFFPASADSAARLADVLVDALSEADLLAVWYRRFEDELMRQYAAAATPMLPRGLEPYYHQRPWSLQLMGLRVLVVHPYEDTIRAQFARRTHLFGPARVWPECELLTLKAVQTLAGERSAFVDWFAALDHMKRAIDQLSFDVAIIGAGAYGFPLAAHVKRRGGMAIHMGGATQLLFGIGGKRWDERPEVNRLYNEFWVRPAAHETPRAHHSVEGGAYW